MIPERIHAEYERGASNMKSVLNMAFVLLLVVAFLLTSFALPLSAHAEYPVKLTAMGRNILFKIDGDFVEEMFAQARIVLENDNWLPPYDVSGKEAVAWLNWYQTKSMLPENKYSYPFEQRIDTTLQPIEILTAYTNRCTTMNVRYINGDFYSIERAGKTIPNPCGFGISFSEDTCETEDENTLLFTRCKYQDIGHHYFTEDYDTGLPVDFLKEEDLIQTIQCNGFSMEFYRVFDAYIGVASELQVPADDYVVFKIEDKEMQTIARTYRNGEQVKSFVLLTPDEFEYLVTNPSSVCITLL